MTDTTPRSAYYKFDLTDKEIGKLERVLSKYSFPGSKIDSREIDNLYIVKSKYDKDLKRRRDYRARPEVKQRRKEYYDRPEVKEKVKAYRTDPKRVSMFRENQKKRRQMLNAIIRDNPSLFEKYRKLFFESEIKQENDNTNNNNNGGLQSSKPTEST